MVEIETERCELRSRPLIAFVVLAAASVILGVPAHAQWERIQVDWTGTRGIRERISRRDSAYPLQFYLTPSADRDFDNSLCLGCDMEGHRLGLQDFTIEISQRVIGQYRGRNIVQIVLSFFVAPSMQRRYRQEAAREHTSADAFPGSFEKPVSEWKSIVVESSAGKYRELYFLIDTGTWIRPLSTAHVLTAGGIQVLVTVDPFNFRAGGCTDGYWVLEPAGPALIDFSEVQKEIEKVIPPDAAPSDTRCDALSMDKLLVSSPVRRKHAECQACDNFGTAVVHFRLDGNRALPVSSSFVPEEAKQM